MMDITTVRNTVTALLNSIFSVGNPHTRTVLGQANSDRFDNILSAWTDVCGMDADALTGAGARDIFQRVVTLLEVVARGIVPVLAACTASTGNSQPHDAQAKAEAIFVVHHEALEEEKEELNLLSKAVELKQHVPQDFQSFQIQIGHSQYIGRGAFGDVVKVTHPADGQLYALKLVRVPPTVLEDSEERAVLQLLTHPGIVRFYLYFANPVCYLFELISGGDLSMPMFNARNSGTSIHKDDVTAVLRQLSSALCYMHGKGVVHRDLKLDNVMLTGDPSRPRIKIIDLGCACILNPTGLFVGKRVGYHGNASYEKWRELPFDGRDDIYAVGRIIMALILGQP
jgi:hypothetical protein